MARSEIRMGIYEVDPQRTWELAADTGRVFRRLSHDIDRIDVDQSPYIFFDLTVPINGEHHRISVFVPREQEPGKVATFYDVGTGTLHFGQIIVDKGYPGQGSLLYAEIKPADSSLAEQVLGEIPKAKKVSSNDLGRSQRLESALPALVLAYLETVKADLNHVVIED